MKRLESNLKNMVLSLTLVALAAAALLGGLYALTKEPIEQQKAEKQQKAITSVLPTRDSVTIAEAEEVGNLIIYRAFKGDNLIGAAVQTEENGFGGAFKVMVGFDKDGNIAGYEVLEHQETPGLGNHMIDWFRTNKNRQSIIGKSPATTKFIVSKDGGDIDAITAATISSRAFLKAVQGAYDAFIAQNAQEADTQSCDAAAQQTEATDQLNIINEDNNE